MGYIPINAEASQRFEEKLAKNPAFSTVDQFIMLYNSGLLNSSNEQIKKVADEIEATYSNVTRQGKFFIVRSDEEDTLAKALFLMQKYTLVAALVRVANTMQAEDYPPQTQVIFSADKVGYPQFLNTEGELVEYPASEKLFKSQEELASNPYLANLINDYVGDDGIEGANCYFMLEDLVGIDTSFITQLKSIVSPQ